MPGSLTEFAPAKVNLFLHVIGRRADGYHLLDSLVVFAEAADVLRAEPAQALTLHLDGPFAAGLAAEPDNLVLRAARALAAETGVAPRARLSLHKNLPVASGIGGGSADAAAALRLLCRLWQVAPDPAALARFAIGLGADVPVCLAGRASRMGGIGERIEPAPTLPACGIVLVNPGVAVATAEVFRNRQRRVVLGRVIARILGRRRGDGGRPAHPAQRPPARRRGASASHRRGTVGVGRHTGLPAGPHERLRRYLFRLVSRRGGGAAGRRTIGAPRLVVLGRIAAPPVSRLYLARRATYARLAGWGVAKW